MSACALTAALFVLLATPQPPAAERLSDKDVKALLEQVNHERDRFEDALDGRLKNSTLRGPGGEVKVDKFLDDLQENVNRMHDRYTPGYSASAEVNTVLQQGTRMHDYISQQAPNVQGASEWNRLAGSLGRLAEAYGTSFPLPDRATARRLNDQEVRDASNQVARAADQYRKALDNSLKADKSIDKATREKATQDAAALVKDAKALSSRIADGKPASGEARQLMDHATRVRSAASGMTLSPAAQTAWSSVTSGLDEVAQGFGLTGPT